MSATPPSPPTNTSFGWTFAAVFALAAAWSTWTGRPTAAVATAGVGAVIAALTVMSPHRLAPFNRAWFHFGLLLGKIVSPVVLTAMYILLILPFALVMRIAGRDALRLKKRTTDTYWIAREPPALAPNSFKNQF